MAFRPAHTIRVRMRSIRIAEPQDAAAESLENNRFYFCYFILHYDTRQMFVLLRAYIYVYMYVYTQVYLKYRAAVCIVRSACRVLCPSLSSARALGTVRSFISGFSLFRRTINV